MAHIIADRIRESTGSMGLGAFALAGAVSGFETFASRLTADGDTTWYCAQYGTEWEVGLGTRTSATVLARTTVLASSNANAAVNFTANPFVFITMPAAAMSQMARLDGSAFTGLVSIVAAAATAILTLTNSAGPSLEVNNQIVSTLATGTAPFSVASTTVVPNLNAQYLSGATFAAPGTIGGGTPGDATFAALTATGQSSFGGAVGAESLRAVPVVSAVNRVHVLGGVASGNVVVSAGGSDPNVPIGIYGKGTGAVFAVVRAATCLYFDNPASAVNYGVFSGAITGSGPNFQFTGSDANVGGGFFTKGTGGIGFFTGGGLQAYFSNTASAIDYLYLTGSSAAFPGLYGAGVSTNVNVVVSGKGTGGVFMTTSGTIVQFLFSHTASAVNYFGASGAVTGSPVTLAVSGADTNAGMYLATKGTASMRFATGDGDQLRVTSTAGAVNHASITGSATGLSVVYGADGSDTNVPTVVTSKGTSPVGIYTNTGAVASAFFQNVVNAVNRMDFYPSAAGGAVAVNPEGSDAAISYHLSTKGGGLFRVFTGSYASEGLRVTHVASTVNYFNVFGAATSGSVYAGTGGSDANAGLVLYSKGSGALGIYTNTGSNPVAFFQHTASVANFWQFYSAATGGALTMYAGGSDANIGVVHTAKGTGHIAMYGNGGTTILFSANGVASSVNYINVFPSATGGGPTVYAGGTDANINYNHSLQGSGSHIFYTGSTSVIQMSISHTALAVNRLDITGAATGNAISVSTTGSDSNRSITFITAGTGTARFSNKIYPGTPAAATQTAAGISGGTGAPSNADASDGDFYFRSDGGALTSIYQKRTGTWVGIV